MIRSAAGPLWVPAPAPARAAAVCRGRPASQQPLAPPPHTHTHTPACCRPGPWRQATAAACRSAGTPGLLGVAWAARARTRKRQAAGACAAQRACRWAAWTHARLPALHAGASQRRRTVPPVGGRGVHDGVQHVVAGGHEDGARRPRDGLAATHNDLHAARARDTQAGMQGADVPPCSVTMPDTPGSKRSWHIPRATTTHVAAWPHAGERLPYPAAANDRHRLQEVRG
jgi:hypothetical protein